METRIHRHLDEVTVERIGDAASVADVTKRLHNEGAGNGKSMKYAASIPAIVIEQYCNLNGVTLDEVMSNPEHTKRMLNDPNMRAFRVWAGRV